MPYTLKPTGRKANDFLADAMQDLKQARQAIYEVFKTTDPVRINRAMADALELLDGVAHSHQEMLLLHQESSKRGEYKKMRSNGAKETSHE